MTGQQFKSQQTSVVYPVMGHLPTYVFFPVLSRAAQSCYAAFTMSLLDRLKLFGTSRIPPPPMDRVSRSQQREAE